MKILILSNLLSYTYNFRKEIIDAFIKEGHRVVIACDVDDCNKLLKIEKESKVIEVPFNGKGTSIKEELSLLNTYRKIIKDEKPDIVFSFTIKMNLYGGLASKWNHVEFVPMITGLGELEKEGKLRTILLFLHKRVMPYAKCVIFQNEDNRIFFDNNGIKYKRSAVVPGSGINLAKFKYVEYPKDDIVNFAFLGRLIKAKGIEEYFACAKELSSDKVVFHAAGPINKEYEEIVKALVSEKKLIYDGVLSDSREYLSSSSCLVLPTFHPEGLSNVILEAQAIGRPVICTPRTGCKEIVKDGINGYYCKEKDVNNLSLVIKKFLSLAVKEREEMGRRGREIVENSFDRKIVVNSYLNLLEK